MMSAQHNSDRILFALMFQSVLERRGSPLHQQVAGDQLLPAAQGPQRQPAQGRHHQPRRHTEVHPGSAAVPRHAAPGGREQAGGDPPAGQQPLAHPAGQGNHAPQEPTEPRCRR